MSFRGYKFKFELHASHSALVNSSNQYHFHNFTIVLYLNNLSDYDLELVLYEDIESYISNWLSQFQNKLLEETLLFHNTTATLETIGDAFYTILCKKLLEKNFELVRLEIYENPTRIYSVSEKILDSTINELQVLPVYNASTVIGEDDLSLRDNICEEIAATDSKKVNKEEINPLIELAKDTATADISNENKSYTEANTTQSKHGREPVKSEKKSRKLLKLTVALMLLLASSISIMYVIKISGVYPRGSDTLCHIYRADLIYHSIQSGVWYPLYDNMWYNGVEIMRYWGPLPLYFIALLQYFAQGDALNAYVLFIGVVYFIGGSGWLLFGWKYNRIGLSTFIGITWFLLPENMRVQIDDGNLPRALINSLLPFLFYFIWITLEEKKWSSLVSLIFINALIGLCHAGIATMVLFSVLIYLIVHAFANKSFKMHKFILIGMILSFALIGIWLFPALNGGAVSKGNSTNQVMSIFFENVIQSLNPTDRVQGDLSVFYYGLSLFVINILGVLLGTKKVRSSFLTAMLIFFCTSKSMYSIFVKLPFSQYLWMIRFIPLSLALIYMSIILWKDLKKWVYIMIGIIIILDILPSYQYIYAEPEKRVTDVRQAQYNKAEALAIVQAKEVTQQRMTLFDLSTYGAFAPYYVSGVEPKVQYTFGAGWEGARTASNIVQINSALTYGNYYFLFDRCLELGDDTILFRIDYLENKERDIEQLIKAGKQSGYDLVLQTGHSMVFHREIGESFGTIVTYKNIAIGEAAKNISLLFPSFKEGNSTNLSDYTFEELKNYDKIYLSDFTYNQGDDIESILRKLAENGVQIYIDMNKIPVNSKTNRNEILGVSAQVIAFHENFPSLYYLGKVYQPQEFSSEEEELKEEITDEVISWNTVYLDGITHIDGYCTLNDTQLVFAGTGKYDNIHFLGFNLLYHALISNDVEITKLLTELFGDKLEDIPMRVPVPLEIEFLPDRIIIDSKYDNVNTALALIDIFHSDKPLVQDNNLLVVNKGRTIIHIKYPYLKESLFLSISGIIATAIYLIITYRVFHKKSDK
jgi:6-pyruvoyl tetrahydropterin synthase-like protein